MSYWKINTHLFKIIASKSRQFIKRGQHQLPTNTITLTRFVSAEERKVPTATGAFTQLLNCIQTAVKVVDVAVRKAGLTQLFGTGGRRNFHGDEVNLLDSLANELFINLLSSSHSVSQMLSEGNEDIIEISPDLRGKYVVCYDPLDGSTNIDCVGSIGSVFGIYRKEDNNPPSLKDILLPGRKMVAAGYALYGSATIIVLSSGNGVNGFMLDHSIGEFLLTDPSMRVPQKGYMYSINEGLKYSLDESVNRYIEEKKKPKEGPSSDLRYVGSMVADVHRTIKYGGIFMYPSASILPEGKLKLLYECNPMAFIVEQAGGMATNGQVPILDIVPESVHQATPFFAGSKADVNELHSFLGSAKEEPSGKKDTKDKKDIKKT